MEPPGSWLIAGYFAVDRADDGNVLERIDGINNILEGHAFFIRSHRQLMIDRFGRTEIAVGKQLVANNGKRVVGRGRYVHGSPDGKGPSVLMQPVCQYL